MEVAQLNLHIQKNGKKGKNSSKGFYIALGVCLVAVGVASWTTYDSVVNYASPSENSSSPTEQANNTVSGVYVSKAPMSSAPKAPAVSSAVPSSKPKPASSSSAASKPVKKKSSKSPVKKADTAPRKYGYPVSKIILQKFSENPVYYVSTQDWRAHTGVDLKADKGDPVKAIADGTVIKVYTDDRYGKTVVINHGEIEAWYCGLDEISVKEKDTIRSEQQIGTVGIVPIEEKSGYHLHFSIKKNGKYVDPLTILQ